MNRLEFTLQFQLPQSLEPLVRTIDAAVQENWDRAELHTGVDPPSRLPIDEPERPAPGTIAQALLDAAGPPSREFERELPPGAEPVRLHPDPVHFGGEITFSPFTHETLGIGGVVSDALGGEGYLYVSFSPKAFERLAFPDEIELAEELRVLDSIKRDGGYSRELQEERLAPFEARADRFRVSPSGVGVSTAPFVLGHALRLLQRARLIARATSFRYSYEGPDDPIKQAGSLMWIPPAAPVSALVASFEAMVGETVDVYDATEWSRPFESRRYPARRRPRWDPGFRSFGIPLSSIGFTVSEEAIERAERVAEELRAEWAYLRERLADEGAEPST